MNFQVRDASPEEILALGLPLYTGVETWVGVLVHPERGIEGHICLSRNESMSDAVLGHDTRCWSPDAHGALLMWRAARKKAGSWGASTVNVHFETEGDLSMRQFWTDRGFTKVMEIYQGEI